MSVLLDTHVLLGTFGPTTNVRIERLIRHLENASIPASVSVASIWEIAIKWRLGKLTLPFELTDLPEAISGSGIEILPIQPQHVLHDIGGTLKTRDPFDLLLLAQCAVEGLKLVTVDKALAQHPLTFRFSER